MEAKTDRQVISFPRIPVTLVQGVVKIEDISWKEAQEVEVLLISEYGRRDLGLGNLVNLTNGGEGTQGIIVSDKTKQNMSISATGRKHSEESKEKNRIASSNVSEETKLNNSITYE